MVGKSGAGKSSPANYLFGTDRFTTGCGVPVTTWEENFQQYFFDIDGVQTNVYDSVGLEPNNMSVWMERFDKFLESKGSLTTGTSVVEASKMMHLIIYAVNGGSGRFEDAEKLDEIRRRHNVKTTAAITNCDIASEDKISGIEKIARGLKMDAVRLCSISRKTRGGEQKEAIEKSDISIFNIDALENFDMDWMLDETSKEFGLNDMDDIENFVPESYKSYCHFIEELGSEFDEEDEFSHCLDTISDSLDSIVDNNKGMKVLEEAMDKLENGNTSGKAGAIFKFIPKILFLKNHKGYDKQYYIRNRNTHKPTARQASPECVVIGILIHFPLFFRVFPIVYISPRGNAQLELTSKNISPFYGGFTPFHKLHSPVPRRCP